MLSSVKQMQTQNLMLGALCSIALAPSGEQYVCSGKKQN